MPPQSAGRQHRESLLQRIIRHADARLSHRPRIVLATLLPTAMVQGKNNFGQRTLSLMTVKAAVLP